MVEGSLRNVPLADVLQITATGRKSGVLSVANGTARARIHLDRGRIVLAHLSPGLLLGEVLVQLDLLTAHEVQELLARQEREDAGTPLGLAATRAGLLDEEDLQRALRRQAVESISELLGWRDGEFAFAERSAFATELPTETGWDAMALLMEADALRRELGAGLADAGVVYRRAADPTGAELPPGAWELLSLVDGLRSARTVASDSDLGERHALRLLKRLEEIGVLEAAPEEAPEPTVLVVAASEPLARLVRLSLLRVGLAPLLFADGEGALAALDAARPSVVVVDDRAGEGWEFVRALRRLPGRGHLPAVVLTGEEGRPGLLGRLRRPRAETLRRPFHELELQQLVARLSGRPLV